MTPLIQTTYRLDDLFIVLNKQGSNRYAKVSYPIRYGRYHEIKWRDHIYQFNLRGEIKSISGLNGSWPHPSEWLKRSMGNDWIYYASGGHAYSGIFDLLGEHYLPCFQYVSNSFSLNDPFEHKAVRDALHVWPELLDKLELCSAKGTLPTGVQGFLHRATNNTPNKLAEKKRTLQSIIRSRIPVLPPDSRHVDYDVLPLVIGDGCLHNCGFCEVKTGVGLIPRNKKDILQQIDGLKEFFGPELVNYNALFLGQNDGLAAGADLICYAAQTAYTSLKIARSIMKEPRLFLFGSVASFLHSDEETFARLNSLPYHTYINIGLESFDQQTLDALKKPVSANAVREAFVRMLQLNRTYQHLEVTANFVLPDNPEGSHHSCFSEIMSQEMDGPYSKGALYFSPLRGFTDRRAIFNQFHTFSRKSHLPIFFYLIQRLC